MRIELKLKIGKNGAWAWVKCECCGRRRHFSSFKKAEEYAEEQGHNEYRARRVNTIPNSEVILGD